VSSAAAKSGWAQGGESFVFEEKRHDGGAGLSFAECPSPSLHRDFPAWHFAMLNDEARNAAIEDAIAGIGAEGKTVFEIGTGSGLVALLFARHGARHVYTCEANRSLSTIAERIVAASRYRDRITVIAASSSDVASGGYLPSPPDIIFTETVDCGVVGEGFFGIRRDIERMAGPHTIVLPDAIHQVGCLIRSEQIDGLNRVGTVRGFDLSAFNLFSTETYFPVRSALYDFTVLSRPQVLRTYRYLGDCSGREETVEVTHNGTAHGVLTWFDLQFAGISVTNSLEVASHWHQAFHPLKDPHRLEAGSRVTVRLSDTGVASLV
jgi:type II protein arginine methyltransferase